MVGVADNIDRRGIHLAGAAFESIGFAFREQATSDFGIDAHLEPRAESRGSGELFALQVKSGDSYFHEPADGGWWLRTDQLHANYWLRHVLPVILVLVDVKQRRAFWEAVTNRTVRFTENGAKILIPRDQEVNATSLRALRLLSVSRNLGPPAAEGAHCRVFLDRGISGRGGWHEFARILIRQLVEIGCLQGWDIVVKARTAAEDDELTEANDYGAPGEELVELAVDDEGHLATYYVPSRAIDEMDLLWDVDCRAEAEADAIVEHLMAAEGLLDEDDWAEDV